MTAGADIERVRKRGRSFAHGPLVLYLAPGPDDQAPSRVAVIAGKKIGGAVERNRAKRLLREAIRRQFAYIKVGWDLLLIARPSIGQADFGRVQASLAEGLKRAQLYEKTGLVADPPLPKDH